MRIKGIRLAWFFLFAFLAGYDISYSQQTTVIKKSSGSSLQVQNQSEKPRVNNFDSLVRKVYLLAEDFFSTDVDYESTVGAGQNGRRVYLKTGEETNVAGKEGDKKSEDTDKKTDSAANDKQEEGVLPLNLEDPVESKPVLLSPPVTEGITADKSNNGGEGGIAGILKKRQEEESAEKQKAQGKAAVSALYWENLRKEYFKKKKEEEQKSKDEENQSSNEERAFLNPERKPENSYRNQRFSALVNKKSYSKDNQHLPAAVYEEEYVNILFQSVMESNLEVMHSMIERLGTTEVRDREGNTPLLYAVMAGNIKSATVLMGMDASVDTKNYAGTSALYAAAYLSRIDLVEGLLQRQAKPDMADKTGKTPLMLAAERNNVGIAEALIEAGANVDLKMRDGNTALHFASRNDAVAVAYALLSAGANTDIKNFEGYTPVMLAAFFGSEQVANLLLNAGADLANKDSLGRNATVLATEKGFSNLAQSIDSEDIRRGILSSKLRKIRTEDRYIPSQQTENAENNIKENKISDTPKPKKIPKPFFSPEEKAKMGGQ